MMTTRVLEPFDIPDVKRCSCDCDEYFEKCKGRCGLFCHCNKWLNDFGSKLMRFIFWFAFVIEFPAWCWTFWQFLKWSFGFYKAQVQTAMLLHLYALHFGLTWSPLAMYISEWEQFYDTKMIFVFIYLGGWIIGVTLESCAISMMLKYVERPEMIREEWLTASREQFLEGAYPTWFNDMGWSWFSSDTDCCAWSGPYDIGVTFNLSILKGPFEEIDINTMTLAAECYNNAFKAELLYTGAGEKIKFEPGEEFEALPIGCAGQILEDLGMAVNLIIITGGIQIGFMILFLIVYCCYPACPECDCPLWLRLKRKLKRKPRRRRTIPESPRNAPPFRPRNIGRLPDAIPSFVEVEIMSLGNSSSDLHTPLTQSQVIAMEYNYADRDIIGRRRSVTLVPKKGELLMPNLQIREKRRKSLAGRHPSYFANRKQAQHELEIPPSSDEN